MAFILKLLLSVIYWAVVRGGHTGQCYEFKISFEVLVKNFKCRSFKMQFLVMITPGCEMVPYNLHLVEGFFYDQTMSQSDLCEWMEPNVDFFLVIQISLTFSS